MPLTSIDHNTQELGAIAAQMAMELVTMPESKPRTVLLEPRLVVRESSVAS